MMVSEVEGVCRVESSSRRIREDLLDSFESVR
jgi:hypothetical protein